MSSSTSSTSRPARPAVGTTARTARTDNGTGLRPALGNSQAENVFNRLHASSSRKTDPDATKARSQTTPVIPPNRNNGISNHADRRKDFSSSTSRIPRLEIHHHPTTPAIPSLSSSTSAVPQILQLALSDIVDAPQDVQRPEKESFEAQLAALQTQLSDERKAHLSEKAEWERRLQQLELELQEARVSKTNAVIAQNEQSLSEAAERRVRFMEQWDALRNRVAVNKSTIQELIEQVQNTTDVIRQNFSSAPLSLSSIKDEERFLNQSNSSTASVEAPLS